MTYAPALTPLGVVAWYLLLSAPLALAATLRGGGAGGWTVLFAHLAAAGGAWAVSRRASKGWGEVVAALVALPLLYAEIPWLHQALAQGYRDGLVQGWEWALLGSDPSRELAARFPSVVLSELLHFAYAAFYPGIYLPPLLLLVRGRRDDAATTLVAVLLAACACFAAFAVFPVQGPRYFGPPEGVPDGPGRSLVLFILERGSSRGAAFPSAHMAIMVAQTVAALRFQRTVGWVMALTTLGLGVGAVYGGFHYAVDILAGVAVGGAAAWVVLRRPAGA